MLWEGVRDYEQESRQDGKWITSARVSGNDQRRQQHTFDPIQTRKIRLRVTATNGDPSARFCEFREFFRT